MGTRNFLAGQLPTAWAITGVTSPKMASDMTIPMGPSTASASCTPRTTGFSPVAAWSAPAFCMVEVATPLVPMTKIWACGIRARVSSTSSFPRRHSLTVNNHDFLHTLSLCISLSAAQEGFQLLHPLHAVLIALSPQQAQLFHVVLDTSHSVEGVRGKD